MSHRIVKPETPRRRSSASDWATRNMRWEALARAEDHAASLREAAREARLVAMSPADRAYELRDRAARAESEAARLRHEHDGYQQAVAPPPRPAPPSPEAIAKALAERAVADSRMRSSELHSLGMHAAKLGVDFDVAKAIADNIPIAVAREQVMDAAADASEAITLSCHTTVHTAASVSHADGWAAALEAVAKKQGLKLR